VNVAAPVMQQLASRETPPVLSDYVLIQQTIENAEKMAQSGSAWRYSMQHGDNWSVATVDGDTLTDWTIQDTPGE
jgi:uncharacterized membrane protein YoaT (DUF817 family)